MNDKPASAEQFDKAHMQFDGEMSYGDYLRLDILLDAQRPLTKTNDELLFIIQHQTSELWMSLILHELGSARQAIKDDALPQAFKMLTRVSKIFEQLNNAMDVLRTMTPSEYTEFREELSKSSGFQSWQYRLIEFMVGNRNKALLKPHAHRPEIVAKLKEELSVPSLYHEVIKALSRANFDIPDDCLSQDLLEAYKPDPSVEDAWERVYQAPEEHRVLYELAEKLVDFEDFFRRWRFNHVTTVERVIGFKRGTGGTNGVSYLKRMLEVTLFPELWSVRTRL